MFRLARCCSSIKGSLPITQSKVTSFKRASRPKHASHSEGSELSTLRPETRQQTSRPRCATTGRRNDFHLSTWVDSASVNSTIVKHAEPHAHRTRILANRHKLVRQSRQHRELSTSALTFTSACAIRHNRSTLPGSKPSYSTPANLTKLRSLSSATSLSRSTEPRETSRDLLRPFAHRVANIYSFVNCTTPRAPAPEI